MIEFALVVIGLAILAFVWFINGLIRDKDKHRDIADEEYAKSINDKRKADRMLDDADYKQRLFDEDNQA